MSAVRLCALGDLDPGSVRRIELDGGPAIAVVRLDDDVYAIGDRCTHQDVALSEGELDPDDRTLECWKHGSTFSLVTGEPTALPATKPTPVYEVSIIDGDVYLEVQ
jgi:3-phenylpropionate/trans-cinnamate dioxygenase ferredoxin component